MKKISFLFFITLLAFTTTFAQTVQKRPAYQNYQVKFKKHSSSANVHAYFRGLAHPVTFVIKIKKGSKLMAAVNTATGGGNIRINKIILPGGESDGPFGKTINYKITKTGQYKIIVGGSNMQADDWKGMFTLRVAII